MNLQKLGLLVIVQHPLNQPLTKHFHSLALASSPLCLFDTVTNPHPPHSLCLSSGLSEPVLPKTPQTLQASTDLGISQPVNNYLPELTQVRGRK